MKKRLADILIVTALGALLSPLVLYAARTAVPIISGLSFSSQVAVNLPPPPSFSLGNSTTTGSVFSNGGSSMYFLATALDGAGGESVVSSLIGTSTVNEAHGWQITWNKVQGATGYRVYFSTSTPQALTQYFTATSTTQIPNNYFSFTSTSSPTFISAGPPGSNSAFVINLNSAGPSWINGGSLGISSTSPWALLSVQATSTANIPLFVAATSVSTSSTAVIITSTGKVGIATSSPYAALSVAGDFVVQSIISTSTLPTLSLCGTGSSIKAGSSNTAGTVSLGINAQGCVISFSKTLAVAPQCVVSSASSTMALWIASSTPSQLAVQATTTLATASGFTYQCIQSQ